MTMKRNEPPKYENVATLENAFGDVAHIQVPDESGELFRTGVNLLIRQSSFFNSKTGKLATPKSTAAISPTSTVDLSANTVCSPRGVLIYDGKNRDEWNLRIMSLVFIYVDDATTYSETLPAGRKPDDIDVFAADIFRTVMQGLDSELTLPLQAS